MHLIFMVSLPIATAKRGQDVREIKAVRRVGRRSRLAARGGVARLWARSEEEAGSLREEVWRGRPKWRTRERRGASFMG
jgi:hypothetical protein